MGNWSLTVNVAGVEPFTPGQFTRLPTGAYAVQITDSDMEQKDQSKHPVLRVDWKVAEEGDFKGASGRCYIGTDWSKDGNRKHMRSLLLGIGAPVDALDAGNVTINAADLPGKRALVYVEAPPPGERTADGKIPFDNRNFISPAYYEKWRSENAAPTKQGGAPAPAANGAAPQPSALGALAGALGNTGGQPAAGGAAFGGGAPSLFGNRT